MATTYNLSPVYQGPQLTNSGTLLVGGKIYWYLAGTSTPVTVYQNASGSAAHTQPIILDSRGEPTAPIYLPSGQKYKAVLQDSSGAQLQVIDNIIGVGDTGFASTTVGQIVINGSGNGVKLYQGASGDLEILTSIDSGTSYHWTIDNGLTFPDGTKQTTAASSPVPIIVNTNTALQSNRNYRTTGNANLTLTLPAAPATGDQIYVVDAGSITGSILHTIARNGKTIIGLGSDLIFDIPYGEIALWYDGTTWQIQ